jgi:hypothetical protein
VSVKRGGSELGGVGAGREVVGRDEVELSVLLVLGSWFFSFSHTMPIPIPSLGYGWLDLFVIVMFQPLY